MCGGASYTHNGEHMRVYFPNPKAKLPVITKESDTKLNSGAGVKVKPVYFHLEDGLGWIPYILEDGTDGSQNL